jgi:hypothetical protein
MENKQFGEEACERGRVRTTKKERRNWQLTDEADADDFTAGIHPVKYDSPYLGVLDDESTAIRGKVGYRDLDYEVG